jgi:hypothetical protein
MWLVVFDFIYPRIFSFSACLYPVISGLGTPGIIMYTQNLCICGYSSNIFNICGENGCQNLGSGGPNGLFFIKKKKQRKTKAGGLVQKTKAGISWAERNQILSGFNSTLRGSNRFRNLLAFGRVLLWTEEAMGRARGGSRRKATIKRGQYSLRLPGVEPGSIAWKAIILTVGLQTLSCRKKCLML